MTTAARSICVWAAYTLVLGVCLLSIPNVILELFGVETTQEVWIRILGMAVLSQAALYWHLARHPIRSGFLIAVGERVFAAIALVFFSLTTGPWQLWLFGVVELAGAGWTYWSVRVSMTGST